MVASASASTEALGIVDVSIPFIAGQWSLRNSLRGSCILHIVSIPFIAGQWSLRAAGRRSAGCPPVSIPFIAGQWSLPPSCSPLSLPTPSRLNPLHCGAVVASSSATPSGAGSPTSLNPLHCGAVVASGNRRKIWRNPVKVSIPFIAGSGRFWRVSPPGAAAGSRSQSPSLRGSGRFPAAPRVL